MSILNLTRSAAEPCSMSRAPSRTRSAAFAPSTTTCRRLVRAMTGYRYRLCGSVQGARNWYRADARPGARAKGEGEGKELKNFRNC